MNITIKDIAREAGVSIATVSNVINGTGRVSEFTARKVKEIVKRHNYTSNMLARGLKNKKFQLISIIVPYLEKGKFEDNLFFWQLLNGVETGAEEQKFNVMLTGIENDDDLSFVNKRYIDGLIVVGINEKSLLFENVLRLNIPCVFMDSYINNKDIYQLYNNDLMGGYLGTKHLIDQGHRKIMLVAGNLGNRGVDYQRWLGYRRALKETGIPYDKELVMEGEETMAGGYYAAQRIFSKRDNITGVFILSDIGAIGLIRGLKEAGMAVPDDISVVGYDDIFYTNYMIPSLTTVKQDIYKKGRTAVRLLLAQVNEEQKVEEKKIILPVELKIRESTSKVK